MNEHRTTRRLRRAAGIVVAAGALALAGAPAASAAEPGWELDAMSVPAAWATTKGAGVTVAVVDSGIRVDHPELAGRAEEGPDMLQETDQDAPYYGIHGTAMASHVLGVAPEARVLGLRAIRDEGDPELEAWKDQVQSRQESGPRDPVAGAIFTAVDSGAGVISLSLGTFDLQLFKYSAGVAAGIDYAHSKGVVVVAASGNGAEDSNDVSYPANNAGVIAVAAAGRSGERADFSTVHSYVDVLAPGAGLLAADTETGGRSQTQGTSSATALVAGVAALIKSAHPDLAPRQIEQVLVQTASHHEQGHDPMTGYGRVDAAAALEAAGALEPAPALLPAAEHTGVRHFGPGPDGSVPYENPPVDSEDLTVAAVIGGSALAVIVVGLLLVRSGRRAAITATAGPPGDGRP